MNLIQTALEALDFHLYDRQGHELSLWPHNDQRGTPTDAPAPDTRAVQPADPVDGQLQPG
jgi:hypothetical protein